jgi:hypothetical protein
MVLLTVCGSEAWYKTTGSERKCRTGFIQCQTKSFRPRTMKFCVLHHKTPSYQEKKPLADSASRRTAILSCTAALGVASCIYVKYNKIIPNTFFSKPFQNSLDIFYSS